METSRDDFVIAIRSAFLKKGNQQRVSILSLILLSIILLILGNFNFKFVKFSKTIIKEIIYASSYIVTVPENIVKKSYKDVSDHFEYYENYLTVKSELQQLKNKDLSKKIITFENIELKKMIDDYFVEDSQMYAKVLSDKESPFLRSIIINKGSKNDVKSGMIVYDDIYLIGKVVEVNFLTSRVLLISDINSKVPVTIQPISIQGIMSGFDKQKGQLQYIKDEKLINKNNEDLIVVTSGLGGIFKSGIPIGKIDSKSFLAKDAIIVNFYRDFSQLKYVKVLANIKEDSNLEQFDKKTTKVDEKVAKKYTNQVIKINNQLEDIRLLQQQKIINDEIRIKFEIENTRLKEDLINTQSKLSEQNKKIKKNQLKNKNIKFLELNLLYGHKCGKKLFGTNLYLVSSPEYRACVFNKGPIKKN